MYGTPLAGCSILIVEDETLIALDLTVALEASGASVLRAVTLAKAMELVQTTALCAAIVDFRLGAERSDRLCAELREHDVPFMLYTGDTGHAQQDVPVVTKPASMPTVVATLTALINRRRT